ncbi:hypothetical protein V8F33_013539 [Rhypophila sp. PSN 637]
MYNNFSNGAQQSGHHGRFRVGSRIMNTNQRTRGTTGFFKSGGNMPQLPNMSQGGSQSQPSISTRPAAISAPAMSMDAINADLSQPQSGGMGDFPPDTLSNDDGVLVRLSELVDRIAELTIRVADPTHKKDSFNTTTVYLLKDTGLIPFSSRCRYVDHPYPRPNQIPKIAAHQQSQPSAAPALPLGLLNSDHLHHDATPVAGQFTTYTDPATIVTSSPDEDSPVATTPQPASHPIGGAPSLSPLGPSEVWPPAQDMSSLGTESVEWEQPNDNMSVDSAIWPDFFLGLTVREVVQLGFTIAPPSDTRFRTRWSSSSPLPLKTCRNNTRNTINRLSWPGRALVNE